MTAEPDHLPVHRPVTRRRGRRVAVALAVLLGSGVAGLWLARVPIATRFVDRELARRGVPARYQFTDLGLGRQRLTHVVIGDPAHPNLVADWVETQIDLTLAGPRLTGVRAGRVRIAARWRDGRVSLGAIDRLLPAPSGKPFALPAIDVAAQDVRVSLDAPAGRVGIRLGGSGRLDDGFRGRATVIAPVLTAGDCMVRGATADLAVRIVRAAPTIEGPVRVAQAACGSMRVARAAVMLDAALAPALDRWNGRATVTADRVGAPAGRMERIRGTIGFRGDAERSEGPMRLAAARIATDPVRGGTMTMAGTWRIAHDRAIVAGTTTARDLVLSDALRRRIAGVDAPGTPLSPIARGLAGDLSRAARRFTATAELALATGTPTLATVKRVDLAAATGERLRFGEGGGVTIGDPRGIGVDGVVRTGGARLPHVRVRIARRPGGAIEGEAQVARYERDGAALTLAPVAFSAARDGSAHARGIATLSGPLGGGRVDDMALPIDVRLDRRGRLLVNPRCAPLSFRRIALGGLVLRPARMDLCPTGAALVALADGRLVAQARVAAPRLDGVLGGTPVTLGARAATAGRDGFALSGVAARLGTPARPTRLDLERIDGRFVRGGMEGAFAGGGQIANVPLLLDRAEGRWSFRDATLRLDGALRVQDAQTDAPRFQPMATQQVALRLRDDAIRATATLLEPTRARKVADVTIDHRLSSGQGAAHLAVPGIAFGEDFQPDLLTRATFGVVADVKGTIRGEGDIRWNADGVTSTGSFSTDGTDLAAAFGPVTGVTGTIRFTDLLALESAPGQEVTIASVNPGVPVENGRVTYRTLANSRVQVDGGTWPFAGGTLTLEPTLLDFSAARTRRMTFRVEGMQAAQFLQQFDFENLDATGIFDGELPMLFDESGGRIEGGHLTARAPGGGIAYVGELTQKQLGFWGDFAFQALKSLTYRELAITMNGPLAGEMVTQVRFAGIRQGKEAKSNFLVRRLTRLPVVFNVNIRAPFRGLIDSAASFYDPSRLVQRNLKALIDEQNRREGSAIQPPASETVP